MYIPRESNNTAPLRALLNEDAAWCWQPEHAAAVNQLKLILSSKHVLKFYDVMNAVTLKSDASQHGLDACLLQYEHLWVQNYITHIWRKSYWMW